MVALIRPIIHTREIWGTKMVSILPPKTDVGSLIGQGLGQGIGAGIQKGADIGFQRNITQQALQGLQNLPPDTNASQLASYLIQATAGIPGAERYVGQLFPLLLQNLRSEQAFGPQGSQAGQTRGQLMGGTQSQEGISPALGASAQSLTPSLSSGQGGQSGGILGSFIPQDQINAQSKQYAQTTGTGLQGYNEMQQNLLNRNEIALQQRKMAEAKALEIGVPKDEIPQFMQIGQRHKNAATFDDWVKSTERDFKEYRNLSKSLDKDIYPGFLRGVTGERPERLNRLDKTVDRLVDLGFEQEVRQKLSKPEAGLSPTEVEERIHRLSPETSRALNSLPSGGQGGGQFKSAKTESNQDDQVRDFLRKNITPNTSLLVLRDKLWNKNYDWQRAAQLINDVVSEPSVQGKLTAAQQNELGTIDTEAPRQSMNYIFSGWGNFLNAFKGQK